MAGKNPWIQHLSAYRKKKPGQSLKQAMRGAKAGYTKVGKKTKTSKAVKTKRGRKKKAQ